MFSMRRVALALATITAAIGVAGCKDKTHGSEQTIKLTEPGGNTGSFGIIGRPSGRMLPAGSGFAFNSPLQDSSKKTVGQLNAFCIATQRSPGDTLRGACNGVAIVPGGELSVTVGGTAGNNVSGAIVGGTGKYTGATGTFTSRQQGSGDNAPSRDTFNITLP